MENGKKPIGIIALGTAVPRRVVTNRDLAKIVDTSDEWIVTRTGIRERHIKDPGEGTSDYATRAAKLALERAGMRAKDIDIIVCGTFSPDQPVPSAACRIQENLGLPGIPAFDVNAACTGFVYSLSVARHMLAGGAGRHALVFGADMVSSVVDWQDRGTCVLFGDGAGAAVVGPVSEGRGILSDHLGADGSAGDLLQVKAGGSRHPASLETIERRDHFIRMTGGEVFKIAVRQLGESVERALEKAGLTLADVNLLVPHQANIRIVDAAAKRLSVPPERVLINIERYGNTSAASIPLVLDENIQNGRIKDGHVLALTAFGAGITWGSMIMRWGR